MSPITTLSWTDGVAYGPRGTRYQVHQPADSSLCECRVYSPDIPGGQVVSSGTTIEGAMLAAQQHCSQLTERIGDESQQISAGGRSQLTRR